MHTARGRVLGLRSRPLPTISLLTGSRDTHTDTGVTSTATPTRGRIATCGFVCAYQPRWRPTSTRTATTTRTITHRTSTGTRMASSVGRSSVHARASEQSRSVSPSSASPPWPSSRSSCSNSVALLADLVHNFGGCPYGSPSRDRVLAAELPARKLAGPRVVAVIFFSCVCRALRDDSAFSARRGSDASLGARCGRCHRLRRERVCRSCLWLRAP
jgi:hypothetical protein